MSREDADGCCLFGNIEQLLPAGTLKTGAVYSEKLRASQEVDIAPRSQCALHNKVCDTVKRPIFSIGGLPCPDMSSAGKKRKRAGPTANCYLSHGRWATALEVPLLLIECTEDRTEQFAWAHGHKLDL